MSNQEQQFYSPEQYPSTPRPSYEYYQPTSSVHVDPREGQQQEIYGGPEHYTGRGEKLQPRSPRRKKFRALWLLPIALLFIAGMSYGLFGSHKHNSESFMHSNPKQTFKVANPKLIINDTSGNIHIRSDEDSTNASTVTVNAERSGDDGPQPVITFNQASGTITVTTTSNGAGDNRVDIEIRTPKTSNVQVVDGSGDVDIQGITGSVTAKTTKGRIDARDISGQVTLASNDGDVSVDNGSLVGQSSLRTDNGDISYNGSLDRQGSYKFDTINGTVNVELPADAAFHVEEHTNGIFNNEFGSQDVGGDPRPLLDVSSENGSIHISKNG